MSTLSEDVGGYAPGHKLTYNGKTYEFHHLGVAELAEFERENYHRARDDLRGYREDYAPSEYAKRLDELRERYKRNGYSLQGDQEFRESLDGVILTLRILLKVPEQEVWELFKAESAEVTRLMSLTIEESFPRAPDPNPRAAGKP